MRPWYVKFQSPIVMHEELTPHRLLCFEDSESFSGAEKGADQVHIESLTERV